MNKHDGMTLNVFEKTQVLEVYDKIAELKADNPEAKILMTKGDTTREEANKCDYLILHYEPMFNAISLDKFDLSKPMYSNPCCTEFIASKTDFLSSLKPSEFYYELMNTKK